MVGSVTVVLNCLRPLPFLPVDVVSEAEAMRKAESIGEVRCIFVPGFVCLSYIILPNLVIVKYRRCCFLQRLW